MGTSYENLMVVGDLPAVVAALKALGAEAWAVPAATGRIAVLPSEDGASGAGVDELATSLSASLHTDVLANTMIDSDALVIDSYRDGEHTHRYISDQAMLVDWFIDDGGVPGFRLDGS